MYVVNQKWLGNEPIIRVASRKIKKEVFIRELWFRYGFCAR